MKLLVTGKKTKCMGYSCACERGTLWGNYWSWGLMLLMKKEVKNIWL